MKRLHGMVFLAVALLAAAVSCSKGPKVIPVRKMEKIYREMFLADQWIGDFGEKKPKADTTWFYEPIFEKYGYNVEDYRKSVDYYLNDPKRYAEMMDRIVKSLEDEANGINKALLRQAKIRSRADSIALAMKKFSPEDFTFYEDIFYVNSMTDRAEFRLNPRGVYYPVPVIEDTIFHGPELIIRDSADIVPSTEQTFKPIPCLD